VRGSGCRGAAGAEIWLRAARGAVLCLVGSSSLGCTQLASSSDTLQSGNGLQLGSKDAVDASSAPPARGHDWSCLAPKNAAAQTPPPPPVVAGASTRVVYSLQTVDLSSGQIYKDVQIRACALTDVTCTTPVAGPLAVDDQGWVDVPLFENFSGYLEIQSPETVPYLFFLTEPLGPQVPPEYPLGLVSLKSLQPLVQLLGVSPQPNTGLIAFRVFDCAGDTASGVTLSPIEGGVPWYFVNGLPSSTEEQTGDDGLGGFVNLPPGLAVIDAQTSDGTSIAGPHSLVVRPNWLSALHLRPHGATTSRQVR
jgi:hypothetical protein